MSDAEVESLDVIHAPVLPTLRRGLRVVPELRDGLVLTVLLAILSALGRVVVPFIVREALDRGFGRGGVVVGPSDAARVDLAVIVRLTLIGLAVVVAATILGQVSRYRLNQQAELALASLRRASVERILGLSIQQHSDMRRGVLVARLTSDVESLSQFFSWGAMGWVLDVAVIVVVGAFMFATDWRLTLVTLSIAVPMIWTFRFLQRQIVYSYAVARSYLGDYLGRVSELVSAAPLIRAYGAQDDVRAEVKRAIVGRRETYSRAGIFSASLGISAEGFSVAMVVTSLVVALELGPQGGLSAGTVVMFLLLISRFTEPFSQLTETVDQTQIAASSMGRILDLIELPNDVVAATVPVALPSGPLSFELKSVEFQYPARSTDPEALAFALRSVNLTVTAGETLAIVGSTGSGKSTLAKLLVRTADPTAGVVLVSGVDISHVDTRELRRRIQLVPQEPFLFNTSIAENIAMAAEATQGHEVSRDDVERVIDQVGLRSWIDSLPEGLNTNVGERGDLLSAGERQLVALARARASTPDVLVLDEATSSVDAATEARLAETIEALSEGRTTVVIAHRLTTVLRADRVVVMENGQIVEVGTPEELTAAPDGVFRGLVAAWERSMG